MRGRNFSASCCGLDRNSTVAFFSHNDEVMTGFSAWAYGGEAPPSRSTTRCGMLTVFLANRSRRPCRLGALRLGREDVMKASDAGRAGWWFPRGRHPCCPGNFHPGNGRRPAGTLPRGWRDPIRPDSRLEKARARPCERTRGQVWPPAGRIVARKPTRPAPQACGHYFFNRRAVTD